MLRAHVAFQTIICHNWWSTLFHSTYSIVFVSVFEHCQQNSPLWILALDEFGRHWCFGQSKLFRCCVVWNWCVLRCIDGRFGRDQFSVVDRAHSAHAAHHGDRIRIVENCCNIYRAENLARRPWTELHLRHLRTVFWLSHNVRSLNLFCISTGFSLCQLCWATWWRSWWRRRRSVCSNTSFAAIFVWVTIRGKR